MLICLNKRSEDMASLNQKPVTFIKEETGLFFVFSNLSKIKDEGLMI